jgi:alpha-ribazole phosphatase
MKVLLLRHGAVCVPSDLCYGHLEVPLQEPTAAWIGAARQIIRQQLGNDFSWWSSPSTRTRRMVELLSDANTVIHADERLREMNFGSFEGRRWSSITQEESLPWTESAGQLPCPGGESFAQLRSRVSALLPIWESSERNVVCVCHGGTIRALLQIILDIPFATLFQVQIHFASFTLLEFRPANWQVGLVNYTLPGYTEVL